MTGLNCSFWGAGQAESSLVFSANPATVPCLLIMLASPLLPPSVGSGIVTAYCHTKGRHVVPLDGSPSALKPQKSSPFGSLVEVSAIPTAWPISLALKEALFCPPSPGAPMSPLLPWYQRTERSVPENVAVPLIKPLLVMKYARPVGPTVPRSVTL